MFRNRGLAIGLAVMLLSAAGPRVGAAQPSAPRLTKPQRAALEALVAAVDTTAAGTTPALAAEWSTHLLRASDGSHYVAVRAVSPTATAAPAAVLYVRLTSRPSPSSVVAERSAVREWLAGQRAEPLPMRPGSSMSVPRGEMPVGNITQGRDQAAESVTALRLLTLERERAARRREDEAADRRAELERNGGRPAAMLPFEDFDVAAEIPGAPDGGVDLRRSITAGPGDYDLHVAWATIGPRNTPGPVQVLARRLRLPAAGPGLALSDLIVAEAVTSLPGPYPAAQQAAHPYATGALEVTPAMGNTVPADGALALLVQVINPSGGAAGKPDVTVAFRVTRLLGDREQAIGTLPVQHYDASRLPLDFDVAAGHPLFAAVRASLASFSRGRYKVTATARDERTGQAVSSETLFEVVGTATSLLREAPTVGQAFRREAVLTPEALAAVTRALTPPHPSDALARGLAAAADGRFAALIQGDAVGAVDVAERPVQQALRALGLYGLGDAPRTVGLQLQAAVTQGAPGPPLALLQGAVYALVGDDDAAIAAWQQSREAGIDDAVVATLLIDAYARQGDIVRALAMAQAALDSRHDDAEAARSLAGLHLARQRPADALTLLERPPLASRTDPDTRFLRLHAMFATLVGPPGTGATGPGELAERFVEAARAYVDGHGPHAALVVEWQKVVVARRRRG